MKNGTFEIQKNFKRLKMVVRIQQSLYSHDNVHMGLDARNPVFGVLDNKGAHQPVHPRSLISAFAFR